MLSGNLVRLGCRLGSVRHRLLIDGDAFACHGGLVDARSPDHDEPVCCQPFIGLYDYGVANDEFLDRSEEHTSELQSLMRISYAVFCLKKKNKQLTTHKCSNSHGT